MAQAISDKIWVTSGHYHQCWLIVDYSMSGQTMTYSVTLHFDGGCAQFRNIYIKVGNTTLHSGGTHAYNASHEGSAHNAVIWSGQTTTITGTQTVTFGGEKYVNSSTWESTTGSFSVTGGVAPANPTVSLVSFTDTSATFNVAVANYGTPASASGRYLEAAVLGGTTYGAPYRNAKATDVSSATITVDNTGGGALTIQGNTEYHYGAFAHNTVLSSNTVASDTFITLPAYITNVTVADDGHNDMTISVLHDSEGSADTVYTEYSYDQTTWTAVPETFHLTVYSATTVYLRRENGAGITPVYTVSIVPVTTIKLYGSVNGQAKTIRKLYGSVNGQSKRIRKLYGSVNGRSKLIFEDNS